jgi:hypothetical protein
MPAMNMFAGTKNICPSTRMARSCRHLLQDLCNPKNWME